MADSQIVYTKMVAERKTEESKTYGFATYIGVQRKTTYPLTCVLRRGMLKGMLTPCVRIASDTPCFRVCLPALARSAFKGYALGYVLGMFWVCFLASTHLYRLGKGIVWVMGFNSSSSRSSSRLKFKADPSTDPEATPRSVPPKHTPKRAKQAYPVVRGMLVSLNPYVVSILRVCVLPFIRKMCPLLRI